MNGGTVLTLALVCLMIGGTAGSMYSEYTAHIRNMNAITARYLAEKTYLDTLTAELMTEIKQNVTQVKTSLKKTSKEAKRHGKKAH